MTVHRGQVRRVVATGKMSVQVVVQSVPLIVDALDSHWWIVSDSGVSMFACSPTDRCSS